MPKAFRNIPPKEGFSASKPNDWRICPEMWRLYPQIYSSLYIQYSSNASWKATPDGVSNAFSYSVPHTGTLPDGRLNDHGFTWSNDTRKATRIKNPQSYPWFADTILEGPRLAYGPDVWQIYGRLPLTWFDATFPGGFQGVAPYHGKGRLFNVTFHDGHAETVQMKRLYSEGAAFFQVK